MTEGHPPSQTAEAAGSTPAPAFSAAQIGQSLRAPLLLLLTSAAIWLVIASVLALITSIKFHSPAFLADTPWLTYGRVRPGWFHCLVYGFGLQAGLAVALWLLARLGQRPLMGGAAVILGGVFWNLGLTIGIPGILSGDGTGFEALEIPGYAAGFLFIGWLLISIPALLTFHYRSQVTVYAALWFILAALFWFPWIYSTACLLLVTYPVRGVAQAVISWWYSQNLVDVSLGMLGLGTAYYLVPKLLGRPLYSRYLALLSFWGLILFSSWGGIPGSAPVPAWMPTISQAATLLTLVLLLAVALNVYQTRYASVTREAAPATVATAAAPADTVPLGFVLVGIICFVLAGAMSIAMAWLNPDQVLQFTWFSPARLQLQIYGFLAFIVFGAAYYLLPQTAGLAFCWPRLVRAHFWLALSGLSLIVLPLAICGVIQAVQLAEPGIPFMSIVKLTTHFLRVTTVGELLLLAGHGLFLANIAGLLGQLYRRNIVPAYETATEDLFKIAESKV